MNTLITAYLLDTDGMLIIWAIAIFVTMISCFTYAFSTRQKDNQENFIRNIKIGAARTIGALLTFFYIWVILLTTIFIINKIYEKQKTNKDYNNCTWKVENNKVVCK